MMISFAHKDGTNKDASNIGGLAHISDLMAARAFDSTSGIYDCASGRALMLELLPIVGMSPDGASALAGLFDEIDLGDGSVQIINWASWHIDPALHLWRRTRSDSNSDDGIGAARHDLFRQAAAGALFAERGWRPRHIRVFVIVWLPETRASALTDRLMMIRNRLAETFAALGTQSRIVTPEILLGLYQELLTPDPTHFDHPRPSWDPITPLNEQCAGLGCSINASFTRLAFERPHKHALDPDATDNRLLARCYGLRQLPDIWTPGASAMLIGDIFKAHRFCPYPLLQSLTLTGAALNRDTVALRTVKKERAANSILRYVMPQLVRESADLRLLNEALADGQNAVRALFACILYAPADAFDAAEASLLALFGAAGFKMAPEHGLHLAGLATCLPMGGNATSMRAMRQLRRPKTMLLKNAITLMPLFGEWRGNNTSQPGIMLLTGRRGQPAGWTPWASSGNYNVAIVGMPGQGKSVAMQEMMNGIIATGGSVVVIDDGYSFRNAATLFGGVHIDFGDAGLRINPFAAIDPQVGGSDFAEEAKSMLVAFLCALAHPGREADDLERALLTGAVEQVWTQHGNAGRIDHVIAALAAIAAGTTASEHNRNNDDAGNDDATPKDNVASQDNAMGQSRHLAAELVTLLKPFASDGTFGTRFEGGCSVDFDQNLVVFEMSALRQRTEIRAAVMVLLIFLATQKMYASPRDHRVAIMIDEAWALLEGTSVRFIEGVARRARKYNGALICATQGVDEFFRNASAEAAWATSDWTVFFKQKESSIATLKREERIDLVGDPVLERGLRALNSIKDTWSEMIIYGPSGWDIHRLLLDDVSLTAFSSAGDDVASIEALVASGMPRMAAIAHYARQIRNAPQTGNDHQTASMTDQDASPPTAPPLSASHIDRADTRPNHNTSLQGASAHNGAGAGTSASNGLNRGADMPNVTASNEDRDHQAGEYQAAEQQANKQETENG